MEFNSIIGYSLSSRKEYYMRNKFFFINAILIYIAIYIAIKFLQKVKVLKIGKGGVA